MNKTFYYKNKILYFRTFSNKFFFNSIAKTFILNTSSLRSSVWCFHEMHNLSDAYTKRPFVRKMAIVNLLRPGDGFYWDISVNCGSISVLLRLLNLISRRSMGVTSFILSLLSLAWNFSLQFFKHNRWFLEFLCYLRNFLSMNSGWWTWVFSIN